MFSEFAVRSLAVAGGSGRCPLSSSHRCGCASMLILSCVLGSFDWVLVFITDSLSDVYLIMFANFAKLYNCIIFVIYIYIYIYM